MYVWHVNKTGRGMSKLEIYRTGADRGVVPEFHSYINLISCRQKAIKMENWEIYFSRLFLWIIVQFYQNYTIFERHSITQYSANPDMQGRYYEYKILYSEIFWCGVHFSPQLLILLYILKELSYTNLTSIGLLQKQNGFDKMGRSVHFLNFYARA